MFGKYLWPETVVGGTSQQPCNFSGQGENPKTRRACVSRGEWSTPPDYAECYTHITMLYREFDAVSDSDTHTSSHHLLAVESVHNIITTYVLVCANYI